MSDLIERDKAIEAIRKLPNAGARWIVSAESVFKVLMQLPSARPQGEWIDRGMRVPSSWVKKCSLCGHETDTWRWCNFCPNCGADMRGDKNGNQI